MKYLLIEALHPQIDDVTEKILDVYRRLKEQREPINIIVLTINRNSRNLRKIIALI
mgnify:CR=1 FL=1